jgi:glutamate N-acetyltransferase/amino-acid N-acetyltransferase
MRPFDLPLGFKYATAYGGIRKQEKDDLALIVSGVPAAAAAVFTTNKVQAAPVRLARANMRASKGVCGAILVNSGNANCATKSGDRVAAETTKALAKLLKLQPNQVLPASTGVIGVELDGNMILSKLQTLVDNLRDDGLPDVARAILTTDLQPKGASREVTLRRGVVRIAGVTKGSGMIHPRMATTLGFVMTDAVIPQTLLRRMLVRAGGWRHFHQRHAHRDG